MAGQSCPNCGAELPATRPYCFACGHRVARTALLSGTDTRGDLSERLRAIADSPGARLAQQPLAVTGGASGSAALPAVTPVPASTPAVRTSAPAPARRRWPHRIAYGLSLLVFAVLAIVGVYAFRVHEVFDTLHTVNTPAPVISGAALGGSADVQIDTGPAQTALAGGVFPTATATPTQIATATIAATDTVTAVESAAFASSTTASGPAQATQAPALAPPPALPTVEPTSPAGVSSSGSGAGSIAPTAQSTAMPAGQGNAVRKAVDANPTNTATATAIASAASVPTDTATPEPTPILSQIERVKNGDFEAGNDGWYLEDAAGVTADDAHGGANSLAIGDGGGFASQWLFFIPGTTYHVSGYARLSQTSKTEGTIGITFTDESGQKLPDAAPDTIVVTASTWTAFGFDYTVPQNAAGVQLYFWKPKSGAVFRVDDLSVRSVVPDTALAGKGKHAGDHSMTILLMGVDARPGEPIDIGVRPDSLMVLHLDADTGSCRLLSIPRDTRTELPGYGLTKINHALAVGGIAYEQQVVENLLGITIDHYVLVDFNGFEDLVDAVGGITVDVPESFTSDEGMTFSVGVQQMTGQQALYYSRWRGGSDGDFGRIQRQQLVLRALVQKASALNIVRSINELLPAVSDNLRTDLTPTQMASIASEYRSRCTESTLTLLYLEGSAATYQDPLLNMPLYYIEIDEAEIKSKVASLMEP